MNSNIGTPRQWHLILISIFTVALLVSRTCTKSLPLNAKSELEHPLYMIARPWTDYAPASAWNGQWIRRPQTALESNLGEIRHDNSLQIQKKWTRLEPSIRFY
ncbi:unnamed protein product [Meloidogyne enterolobii]|uniref:Uncharacterized protein n=2 Tax=Meloidogyne enterolobii TaxID=390850 RepID=A0A6V7X8D7_MELEN|nr:unnamed protein product [Meloidogyne enterolobii]